jgi:predicted aspartyl protease
MEIRRIRPVTPFLIAGLLVSGSVFWEPSLCRASSDKPADVVPFKLTASGLIKVPVTINGKGPFNFVLDTGSNRSAVTSKIATELQLKAVAQSRLVSSVLQQAVDIVRFETLALGSFSQDSVLATVLPERDAAALGVEADGIIGQDVLGNSDYTLDYEGKQLVWGFPEEAAPSASTRLSLRRDEGRWLVGLPQNKDGGEILWFVPDSGATGLVVFDRGAGSPLRMTRLSMQAEVSTATGERQVQAVLLHQFRAGEVVFHNCPALLVNRHEPDAPAGDGLLPLSAFASVTFRSREGLMFVRGRR